MTVLVLRVQIDRRVVEAAAPRGVGLEAVGLAARRPRRPCSRCTSSCRRAGRRRRRARPSAPRPLTGFATAAAAPASATLKALRREIAMARPPASGFRLPASGVVCVVDAARGDVAGAEHRAADDARDGGGDRADPPLVRVDRRVGVGRGRPVDRHRVVHRDAEGDAPARCSRRRDGRCRSASSRRPRRTQSVEQLAWVIGPLQPSL